MSGRLEAQDLALAALEEGIRLYDQDDILGAHAHFGEAYKRAPQMTRVVSWYGLTLVLVERNSNLGVALCDQALRVSGPEPELLLNQARAHLALGQRDRAVKAILRGLAEWPGEPTLCAALEDMGRRQRPVIPFLPRGNPLNRILGRIRHRSQGSAARRPVGPAALGRRRSGSGPTSGGSDG